MNKQFMAILAIVVALMVGAFWLTKKDTPNTNGTGSSGNAQPSNHVVGAGNKGVTLLEYGDFECPACGAYYPLVKQIKAKYGDDITFQFRNFPLVQLHKNAMLAHRAAEASGLQGKFFEMHDLLYENQRTWTGSDDPRSVFEQFATQLALDIDKFRTDMNSEAVNNQINADIKAAQAAGGTSTPTFVLQDEKIENPTTIEDFYKLIDDAIAKKAASQPQAE